MFRILITRLIFCVFIMFVQSVHAEETVSSLVALINFKPKLGDLTDNINRINILVKQALDKGANIVVVPEQSTTGFNITKQEALDGLAISYPFPQLAQLKILANQYNAFIIVGVAERQVNSNVLFNSAVLFQPSGTISIQRKRMSSSFSWNATGDTPFDVYKTPWGDIGILICADSFLMDWMRIATIKGADIILLPANWWGQNKQLDLWSVRARQNGVWVLAANRWGEEINTYPPPINFYMSDSPTAAITPSGLNVQRFAADQNAPMTDTIIYQNVAVPKSRIGAANPTYTVANRRPSAYVALANKYYTPPDNESPPNLPTPGQQIIKVLAYQPSNDADVNLKMVNDQLKGLPTDSLIVLPGLGLVNQTVINPVTNPMWYQSSYWSKVTEMVVNHGAQGLVTSVLVQRNTNRLSLDVVYIPAQGTPILFPGVHDSGSLVGSGIPPKLIRLKHAEVAVMTGIDSLFPEMGTQAAKSGADIVVVVSSIAGRGTPAVEASRIGDSLPTGWSINDLAQQWQIMANSCMHVIASDASGYAFSANQQVYCLLGQAIMSYDTPQTLTLDTSTQRMKNLNWYYTFDLNTLLDRQ